jgi:hypothetical protein
MTEETKSKAVAVVHGTSMMNDTALFEHTYRWAKVFSGSQLVPKHLQGKVEDIMIALNIAERLKEDALTVMQSIYIVSGKAGWSASYMIARINQSGLIKGSITWDVAGAGKDLAVTAKATLASTGEAIAVTVTMQMAIAEGWVSNKKYSTMPELMLRYRSAAMLQRLYFPQVMLGMRTVEELETEAPEPQIKDVTPPRSAASALSAFAANAPPEPQIISDEVPPDGPNAFDRDDEASVANLKNRTGVVDEPEPAPDEAEVMDNDFDPQEYLNHCIEKLASFKSPDEVGGANAEVKKILKEYPKHLGEWNSARFEHLSKLSGVIKPPRK